MTQPSNIVQTAQGKRKRKHPFRVLLEQYLHEAGGTFDPADVVNLSIDAIRASKPVEASLIDYLDRMASRLQPEARTVALQARAYLTELSSRQSNQLAADLSRLLDQDEEIEAAIHLLKSGSTPEEIAALVGRITADLPQEYAGKSTDEINAIAAELGLRGKDTPTPLRAKLAQRPGTKWYNLAKRN